jgi:hypothetical protein
MVENYDPISAFSYWRSGELGLGSWLSSLRTVQETAWFARDDLRPFGLMCVRMGLRLATRPLGLPQGRASSTDFRYSGGRAAGRVTRPGRSALTAGDPETTTRPVEPRGHKEGQRV